MTFIDQISQEHKELASVLKNHRGIREMVEELYPDSAHFIYELLQNAEDTGATEVIFDLSADRLVFEHNGREFNKADVKAITDVGAGTKAQDNEQIGRFGIGFKSVFAYTETPHIWSPSYSFKISEMVLPSELSHNPDLGRRTRFEFPFNSKKKPKLQAFAEVKDFLKDISDSTLLFLSHIESIQWQVEGGHNGCLLRITDDFHLKILREIDGSATKESDFACFRKPVGGLKCQYVAIAFKLESRSREQIQDACETLAKQYRIVPAEPGCVAIYFNAVKETSNLHFHLHAPFVPELSRSSIKDAPANEPLFSQLAELAAESLPIIRNLGLLDRDFLAVLPNDQDGIPPQYSVIQDAIVDVMKESPLTPTHNGRHAPANRLLQAEAGLKNLLDSHDIDFLTNGDDEKREWAVAATQRNNRVDRFLDYLDIEKWGVEQFVEILSNRCSTRDRYCWSTNKWIKTPDQPFLDWMHTKPLNWHQALYALLLPVVEKRPEKFDKICIVRRSDGQYGTGDTCYFPTPDIRDDPIHPRVEEETYAGGGSRKERKNAKEFLEGIGVREIGERQQIEAILEKQYRNPDRIPDTHDADIKRFISFVRENSNASDDFKDYSILQGADGRLHRPCELYLDVPYPETGLVAYYGQVEEEIRRVALSDCYLKLFDNPENIVAFASDCGVANKLDILEIDCSANPKWKYLKDAPGRSFRETGVNRDFTILQLSNLFKTPTVDLSRLVWKTLCKRSREESLLKATFQKSKSNEPHQATSQLVYLLQYTAWIPQINNSFVRPAEAKRDLLPEGFPFDHKWPWIEAIHFGAKIQGSADSFSEIEEIATKLGFSDEADLSDARKFVGLKPHIRRKFLEEHSGSAVLPNHESNNSGRRAESVREEAKNAPKRRKENRQRSISEHRDEVKRAADPYLCQLYTNSDGETICQVCRDRLPFKLADGNYFFEKVEFLPDLERHHHQNYLALCPNHAAMFKHANGSKENLKDLFLAMENRCLELTLAEKKATIYFNQTHTDDLRAVIEVDDED